MLQDLRFTLRLLLKQPGFAIAAILALGLGIGLSTAVFNAFAGMLLRPASNLHDADRIVVINSVSTEKPDGYFSLSLPDFEDLRAQSKTLEGFTTIYGRTMIFTGVSKPDRYLGASISIDGFPMLGVKPVLGRVFEPTDISPGAPPVVIISYGIWQKRYGGNEEIIGRVVELNGQAHTIVGVMPRDFVFPDNHEMWVPNLPETKPGERGSHDFPGWARLKPGVSLDEARAEITGIGRRLALTYPLTNEGKNLAIRPLREEATHNTKELMQLMLAAAIAVLLIACANVANLMLARASSRSHEIAIRISVGATRGRIIQQVLTESAVLGILGGAFGLLVATWAESILFASVPHDAIPAWMTFGFDWRVFTFAVAAALLSSLAFGLIPALQISGTGVLELRENSRAVTASRGTKYFRHTLVVAQVALSAVLLIAAGLFVRSFLKLQSVDPGFDARGVITFRVGLPPTQFQDREKIRNFFDELDRALASIPGVEAVGATQVLPGRSDNRAVFVFEGDAEPTNVLSRRHMHYNAVSRGYFSAMRIPAISGRMFAETDTRDKPTVAIVDRTFVNRWMNGRDPLGQRISLGLPDDQGRKWAEIIGVVGDVPQRLDRTYELGGVYFLLEQSDHNFVSYALRVSGDPSTYGRTIQQAVSRVQPDIPIYDVHTLEYLQRTTYWQRRFFGQVFGAFGLGALFLAAIGVYSVMAYAVTQRTPEIGVRMALGASESEVLSLIGKQGLMLVIVGMGIGLISALGLTRLMAGLLYGITPSDPPTYFSLTFILALVATFACWLPARRATRINPMIAIRSE
jgi:putative ABC transport system permease protein